MTEAQCSIHYLELSIWPFCLFAEGHFVHYSSLATCLRWRGSANQRSWYWFCMFWHRGQKLPNNHSYSQVFISIIARRLQVIAATNLSHISMTTVQILIFFFFFTYSSCSPIIPLESTDGWESPINQYTMKHKTKMCGVSCDDSLQDEAIWGQIYHSTAHKRVYLGATTAF